MEVSGQLHAPVAALPPRERAAGTDWIGGCVGPRAGLDAVMVCRKYYKSLIRSRVVLSPLHVNQ
jgi:hypothetical protein